VYIPVWPDFRYISNYQIEIQFGKHSQQRSYRNNDKLLCQSNKTKWKEYSMTGYNDILKTLFNKKNVSFLLHEWITAL
jgi:hypothetical protein